MITNLFFYILGAERFTIQPLRKSAKPSTRRSVSKFMLPRWIGTMKRSVKQFTRKNVMAMGMINIVSQCQKKAVIKFQSKLKNKSQKPNAKRSRIRNARMSQNSYRGKNVKIFPKKFALKIQSKYQEIFK